MTFDVVNGSVTVTGGSTTTSPSDSLSDEQSVNVKRIRLIKAVLSKILFIVNF
ncbi:hypothetical protein D3C86_2089660 [compost metagenome]